MNKVMNKVMNVAYNNKRIKQWHLYVVKQPFKGFIIGTRFAPANSAVT